MHVACCDFTDSSALAAVSTERRARSPLLAVMQNDFQNKIDLSKTESESIAMKKLCE